MVGLDQLAGQMYLNLETFRKNGVSVKTPVWFVQEGETLFIRTMATSGKVKRVRLNSRVNVAPCKVDGALVGEWLPAKARAGTDDDTAQKVDHLLDEKYGEVKKQLSRSAEMANASYAILEVKLEPAQ